MPLRPSAFLVPTLLLLVALAAPGCRREPRVPSDRPNIVFIVTDDQELTSLEHMPVLRKRMMREGLTFENAFVTTSECCPSRASILTGLYAHNHGVFYNRAPQGGWPVFRDGREADTIAVWLSKLGYRSMLAGKYLNDYHEPARVPPGWDEWYAMTDKGGYVGYDYTLSENGKPRFYGEKREDYFTDVILDKTIGFIRRAEREKDRQPFFVYFAPTAPHSPSTYAKRDRKKFRKIKAPRPPSFDEADVSDKPDYVRAKGREGARVASVDHRYPRYLRALAGVDRALDRILDVLDETRETEDTYVFFFSDNGYLFGQHRDVGKGPPYEESIRVPLVVRGPGVPRGSTVRAMALNIDLAPTFLAIAGGAPRDDFDGRSLLPFLRGAAPASWRKDFLIEYQDYRSGALGEKRLPRDTPSYRGLRSERYVYIEYLENGKRIPELYDLEKDPYELNNRASLASAPQRIAPLRRRLHQLERCRGKACF